MLLEQIKEKKEKIKSLIDKFILFLKKDNDVYGTDEPSRIIFARMKKPNKETPEGWEKEASFPATNLSKLAKGENQEIIFGYKDIKDLEIIEDKDELIDLLIKQIDGNPKKEIIVKADKPTEPEIQLKEK